MGSKNDQLIELLKKCGVITQSKYVLARGVPSTYFFDIDKVFNTAESIRVPQSVQVITSRYSEKIREIRQREPKVDRLAFIEKDFGTIGALLFISSIVLDTGLDASIIRLRKEIPFYDMKGAPIGQGNVVIIVSDVLTSGEGVARAAETIQKYGAQVPYAVVLYDREQLGKESLEKLNIRVEPILAKQELLEREDIKPNPDEAMFSLEADIIPPAKRKSERLAKALGPESWEVLKRIRI